MRIVAGAWRGRALLAPAGQATRPTAQRVRQALFDMLAHAPWGGRAAIEGVRVLDLFAGTGALGLEALSRGAAHATFVERDRAALVALRANVTTLGAAAAIHAGDATRLVPGDLIGLAFLDPPYGFGLIAAALAAWLPRLAGALVVAELARDEAAEFAGYTPLAERSHGAARIVVLRAAD